MTVSNLGFWSLVIVLSYLILPFLVFISALFFSLNLKINIMRVSYFFVIILSYRLYLDTYKYFDISESKTIFFLGWSLFYVLYSGLVIHSFIDRTSKKSTWLYFVILVISTPVLLTVFFIIYASFFT